MQDWDAGCRMRDTGCLTEGTGSEIWVQDWDMGCRMQDAGFVSAMQSNCVGCRIGVRDAEYMM